MAEYTEDSKESKPKKDNKDLLVKMRACYKKAVEADSDNRRAAIECIKFARLPGNQWADAIKTERGNDRPMLEFNKTKIKCKRVINEMRSNRPQEKVRGTEDNDVETAETIEGLIRNIHNVSDTESISDYQAEYQVLGGYGVFEMVTEYSSDTAWDQDLLIKNVPNPFCVWSDPSAKDMLKSDADWWLKSEKIKKASFEARWPKAEKCSFEDTEFDDDEDWEDDESVRICEYWYKVPDTKEIALLQDGSTVDLSESQPDPALIKKRRTVKCHKVMSAICSGDAVLEPPSEFVIDEFPFVPVFGDYLIIDGKTYWSGMVVDLKDAQRAFNAHQTNVVETVESAAKPFHWVTAVQATGHTQQWAEAHAKNFPQRLYNADPASPGPPIPGGTTDIPQGLVIAAQQASELMDSLAGFEFDPSGADAQNISGRALNTRVRQGQLATFNYPDNMGKSRKRLGKLLIKAIPKIYDTERSVRILGADGAEKFTRVNSTDPKTGKPLNDLSRGKFDLTVTVGPSYATQRQESTETFTEIGRAVPQIWQVAGDLMVKNMDVPGAEQIAKRLEFLLPPPIQQTLGEGKEMPPEVQRAMMQVDMMGQQIQQQGKLVEQAAVEAQQEAATAKAAKSEVQIAQANLKTEEANFRAMQADFEKLVAQTEAKLQKTINDIQMSELQHETDKADAEKVGTAADMALQQIQALSEAIKGEFGEMLSSAAQVVMEAKANPMIIDRPRAKRVSAKRVNGQLVGEIEYEDGTKSGVNAARGPEGLVANVQPDAAIPGQVAQ